MSSTVQPQPKILGSIVPLISATVDDEKHLRCNNNNKKKIKTFNLLLPVRPTRSSHSLGEKGLREDP